MVKRNQIPDTSALVRLWLCALLMVQSLVPGLSLAALPSGPVVQAILCAEHGPVEVLIDLDTGEPVEPAQHLSCGHCLACAGSMLGTPGYDGVPVGAAMTGAPNAVSLPLMRPAIPRAYAAARGPPRPL